MKYIVDIDGTLLYTKIVNNLYYVTGVNTKLVDKLNKLLDEGHEIILHTARHWNKLMDTKIQLFDNNIKYTTLVMGKPVGDYYIDDKGIRPDEFLD